jgi:hypothetical protein
VRVFGTPSGLVGRLGCMKTSRLVAVATLAAAALPAAVLLAANSAAASRAPTLQAPGPAGGHTYCAYSSSTPSTSASPAGGSCSTISSTPSSA